MTDGQVVDALRELLGRVDAGELGDPLPVLAYLAGQEVEIADEELNGARRRALLLVAAGGDPHRALGVDDRDRNVPERFRNLGMFLQ